MSREKQIEEMAKDLYGYSIDTEEDCDFVAKLLYAKGYRKQSVGEWISVDERLPHDEKAYLCTDGTVVGIVYYSKKFGFEDYAPFDKITHWMPLPEAPKMKGGAE